MASQSSQYNLDDVTEDEMWVIAKEFYDDIGFTVYKAGECFEFDVLKKHYKQWLLRHHPDKVAAQQGQNPPPPKKRKRTAESTPKKTPTKRDLSQFPLPKDLKNSLKTGAGAQWKRNKDFFVVVPTDRLKEFTDCLMKDTEMADMLSVKDREIDQEYSYILLRYLQFTTVTRLEKSMAKIAVTVKPLVVSFKAQRLMALYEFILIESDRFTDVSILKGSFSIESRCQDGRKFDNQMLAEWVIENMATSASWVYVKYRQFRTEPHGIEGGMCQCCCGFTFNVHKQHKENAEVLAGSKNVKEIIQNALLQYRYINEEVVKESSLERIWTDNVSTLGAPYIEKLMDPNNEYDRIYLWVRFKHIWETFDSMFIQSQSSPTYGVKYKDLECDDYFNSFLRLSHNWKLDRLVVVRLRKVVLFLQSVFECIVEARPRCRCLMFQGDIETGKSTLAQCITELFNGMNGTLPVDSQNAFQLGEIAKSTKMVMFDDFRKIHFQVMDDFRAIFDGRTVQLPVKHSRPVNVVFPPMVITTNCEPSSLSKALMSRIRVISFKNKVIPTYSSQEDVCLGFVLYIQMTLYMVLGGAYPIDGWTTALDKLDIMRLEKGQQFKHYSHHKDICEESTASNPPPPASPKPSTSAATDIPWNHPLLRPEEDK
ncbi:TPA_asm: large T antigen-like [Varicolored abalone xenomavirus]|nr:TPA_asm: large T antigen-like [Varicolored abalone xenomavirus]